MSAASVRVGAMPMRLVVVQYRNPGPSDDLHTLDFFVQHCHFAEDAGTTRRAGNDRHALRLFYPGRCTDGITV